MRINKPVPILYDYKLKKLTTLYEAYNINENKYFGDIYDITFDVAYNQYDSYNNIVLDVNNKPIVNVNYQYISNEQVVLFNENYYLIKNHEITRANDNSRIIRVYCKSKAIELSYKNVSYLDMTPPVYDVIRADGVILNILTAKFSVLSGNVISSTNNTVTLPSTSSVVDDYYNGKKIAVYNGLGVGQNVRITDYVGSTKIATLESNWDTNPNTTSQFHIHYSKWTVGTVDNSFLNDGSDIFRAYRFEDISMMECLINVKTKFDSSNLTYSFDYDNTYDEFINKVNLVKANSYDNIQFRYTKNLNAVTKSMDSNENAYTRVFPYGRDNLTINDIITTSRTDYDETGSPVNYNDHVLGQSYIENYQYYLALGYDINYCRETFVNDFTLNDDTYVDDQDIYDDAKIFLEELSMPKITYETTVVDLSLLTGYSYESFEIGDTIKVIDNELGIDIDATLVSKNVNWDNPQNAVIQLSNFIDNLGDYLSMLIEKTNKNLNIRKVYGKTSTIIIADQSTSKNWKYADYFIPSDGSKTADEVIQAVIDDLPSEGGRIVLLEGAYNIYIKILLDTLSNIVIEGQGDGTVIKFHNDIEAFYLDNVSNINIKNLKISNAGSSGKMIYIIDSNNINISNITFLNNVDSSNAIDSCIYIVSCNKVNIENNSFTNLESTYIIRLTDGEEVNIINNKFYNSSDSYASTRGILFNKVIGNNINCLISDNKFNLEQGTINMDLDCSNTTITSNNINYGDYGLFFEGDNNIINNNIINDVRYTGIHINGDNNLISNNYISDCEWWGIYTAVVSENSITNNYLNNNCTSNTFNDQIAISGNSASGGNVNIINNTIRNAGVGAVNAINIYSGATNTLVDSNDIKGGYTTTAILDNGTGTVIGFNRT